MSPDEISAESVLNCLDQQTPDESPLQNNVGHLEHLRTMLGLKTHCVIILNNLIVF